MTRRRCTGITRKGKPCQARPLTGTERCAAHPLSPASTRFGSPAQARAAGALGGRPALPRPTDVARKLIEENVAALLRPHFRVLGYDVVMAKHGWRLVEIEGGGAKLHASFRGDTHVSGHDDLGAHMEAAERLLDRVYGKPRQALEHSGPDGGAIHVDDGQKVDLRKLDAAELDALETLLARATPDA